MLPRESGGVVDKNLLVYGTSNLRVIDASVPPLSMSAHLMSIVYGIGEIGAEIVQSNKDNYQTGNNQNSSSSDGGSGSGSGSGSGNSSSSKGASSSGGNTNDAADSKNAALRMHPGAWASAVLGAGVAAVFAWAL